MSNEWDREYVLRKRPTSAKDVRSAAAINAAAAKGNIEVTRKTQGGTNKHSEMPSLKIAETDDIPEIKHVGIDVARAMQQARQQQGLSQKDLAVKVNEKATVINDYESGRAVPSQQVLGKLERALGVRLRGSHVGQSLK